MARLLHRHVPRVLATVAAILLAASTVHAEAIDLSIVPVDVDASVPPNIVMTFDDSGSMASAYMPDSVGIRECAGESDFKYFWSGYNKIYYNPATKYEPTVDKDNVSFGAINDFTKVPVDGIHYKLGNYTATANLDNNYRPTLSWNWDGSASHSTLDWDDSDELACIPAGARILGLLKKVTGVKAFYYKGNTLSSLTLVTSTDAEFDKKNFANWYAYYRTRNLMTRTAISRAFAKMSNEIRVVFQNINDDDYKLPASTTITEFVGAARTDFFSWLYRVQASGTTPDRAATIRAGEFFRRSLSKDAKDPYWNGRAGDDSKDLVCRQNFHMLVTDGYWNESNPAAPAGFFTVQNARKLPDDHQYTPNAANTKVYSNVPASSTGSCGSNCSPTLADLAFFYWATDLQPNLDNKVPPYFPVRKFGVPNTDDSIYFHPENDPASWQHVVQYMVTLGVAGARTYPTDLTKLMDGSLAWPKPQNNSPEAVDDTWHAAVNSRGTYFSASDPQSLVDSLTEILSNVIQRKGSTAAAAVNSGVLTTGSEAYVTGYDSADWSGFLQAFAINQDTGKLAGEPSWDGSTPAAGSRVILTATGPGIGKGVEFKWSSLTTAQQESLNYNPTTKAADTNGSSRLDWLRGDTAQEDKLFRKRISAVGSIINSQAVYVSFPSSGYRDDFGGSSPPERDASYEKFAFDNKDRMPAVYAGANDGMLHAFAARAEGTAIKKGQELFAYVPATVYPNLSKLPEKTYALQPYVDNTPVVRDVFWDKTWHTVLVGTLRLGGRGVFALDITSPKLTAADAATKVLWEFNNTVSGAAELGYTYGQPNIARLAEDNTLLSGTAAEKQRWVVLVPGGYFPKDSLDPNANVNRSSLFVLDVKTGALLKTLTTPIAMSSFGLAGPVVGDYNDDQVDDVAFAGDLVGNLWRFDLRSGKVDLVFKPATAKEQPITAMPRLFPDPVTQKLIVVFGTGKYLGKDDRTINADTPYQAVYGIRDYGESSSNYPAIATDLVQQEMKLDGVYRTLTDKPVPASDGIKTIKGWYFKFAVRGERVAAAAGALFNTNRAIVASVIPGIKDPCNPTRDGAAVVIDATNGGPADNGESFGASGVSGYVRVGRTVNNPPAGGSVPMVTQLGGGKVILPGVVLDDSTGTPFSVWDSLWRRRAWRDMLVPYQ